MEEFNVFQLKTKRVYVCTGETTVYGEARLVYPNGEEAIIEKSVRREYDKDNTWEQRVIAYVIGFLQDKGYKFLCLTDASEYLSAFSRKTWMIVTSRTS